MHRLSWILLLAWIGTAPLGCLSLMGGEERAGSEAASQVETEVGLVESPELVAYVREIGKRLAANASRDGITWRFRIIDMPEPNAFALPGGFVYVSRGLLALVNDEDELAGVIGHEIGHVTARHGNKRVTLSAPFAILTGITSWATGIVSPALGNAVAGAGSTLAEGLVVAPFSRSQESEADRIGAGLAAKAGYDPQALGRFLASLGRFETLASGEERSQSWLDSHPSSPERAAASKKFAAGLTRATPSPVAKDRAELLARLDGLLLGPDPNAGVVQDQRFLQPLLGFQLEFPPGWSVLNSPQAVASQDPAAQAALVLQLLATERSLDQAIAEVRGQDPDIRFERFSVNGLSAARTQVEQRGRIIDITWIQHRGDVYQVAGITDMRRHASWVGAFRKCVESFREARPAEIRQLRARRVRIATLADDESLETLLERVGSAWELPMTEVANGLDEGEAPPAGSLVKYGRDEPFL